MSILLSSGDWLWIDFSLAVIAGFIFGTGFLELVESALFWLDHCSKGRIER